MTGPQWSSRSLGSRFKHEFFYRLIRHVGAWAAYPLLYAVVLSYSLRPSVYRRSRPYLSRRFPGSSGVALWRKAFRLNLSFGLVLLERAVMGITGRMEFAHPENGGEAVKKILAEGRGLVALTAHVGAWQTGLGWLAGVERPVNIAQRRQDEDNDRHYFEHRPGAEAPKIINLSEAAPALAAMAAALLAGEVVAMMGDRIWQREALTLKASLMGGPIMLPGAPFYLAAKTGAPLAVVFTRRAGPSRVEGRVWKIIRPPQDGSAAPESLAPLAEAFAACLEEYAAAEPYQFFNFYDMWNLGENHEH
ncbi:MAG: lipid A biosynthesis acyltransferase [Candidatus Adiutrix sp.]|jgi:predicted LPLAT superfamily acyltransferase|nr:lipid A biosynthesis acyltransferase [Candidatus Adiutrix sp.]